MCALSLSLSLSQREMFVHHSEAACINTPVNTRTKNAAAEIGCECVFVCEDLPMKLFGRRSERNRFIFILVLLARWTAKFVVSEAVVVHLLPSTRSSTLSLSSFRYFFFLFLLYCHILSVYLYKHITRHSHTARTHYIAKHCVNSIHLHQHRTKSTIHYSIFLFFFVSLAAVWFIWRSCVVGGDTHIQHLAAHSLISVSCINIEVKRRRQRRRKSNTEHRVHLMMFVVFLFWFSSMHINFVRFHTASFRCLRGTVERVRQIKILFLYFDFDIYYYYYYCRVFSRLFFCFWCERALQMMLPAMPAQIIIKKKEEKLGCNR